MKTFAMTVTMFAICVILFDPIPKTHTQSENEKVKY